MNIEHLLNTQQALKTHDWLNQLQAQYQSTQIQWQILFAKINLALNPRLDIDLKQLVKQTTDLTDKTLLSLQSETDLDPYLITSVAMVYQQQDIDISQLNELVDKISQSLQSQSSTVQTMGRVRNINKQLIALGKNNQLSPQPKAIQQQFKDHGGWLTLANEALIEMVLHCIADDQKLNDQQSQILSLIALGEMRNGQIDAASKLLRLVIELGVISEETEESLHFIAMQRRQEGYYGFTNPLQSEQPNTEDQILAYHFPLTINIVWLFTCLAIKMDK